jgi:hypothetical protein
MISHKLPLLWNENRRNTFRGWCMNDGIFISLSSENFMNHENLIHKWNFPAYLISKFSPHRIINAEKAEM